MASRAINGMGMAYPMKDRAVIELSKIEYCRMDE